MATVALILPQINGKESSGTTGKINLLTIFKYKINK